MALEDQFSVMKEEERDTLLNYLPDTYTVTVRSEEKLRQVGRQIEEMQHALGRLERGKTEQTLQSDPTTESRAVPCSSPTRGLFDNLLEGEPQADSVCEPAPAPRPNTALVVGAVTTGVLAILVLFVPGGSPWMALLAGALFVFGIVSGVAAMWHDR